MSAARTFNVYCDESSHLEHDQIPARAVADAVRALKAEHGLKPDFEAKWTKVSPAKAGFYLALVDLLLAYDRLRFRGLVVPDKGRLDHTRFDQSPDDWYCDKHCNDIRKVIRL